MFEINGNSIFTAKAEAIPGYNPIGELYEDFYLIPVKDLNGESKTHLIQSGKFYIRELSYIQNENKISECDYFIDPETLIDITDYENPIFMGCDLARELDETYYSEHCIGRKTTNDK